MLSVGRLSSIAEEGQEGLTACATERIDRAAAVVEPLDGQSRSTLKPEKASASGCRWQSRWTPHLTANQINFHRSGTNVRARQRGRLCSRRREEPFSPRMLKPRRHRFFQGGHERDARLDLRRGQRPRRPRPREQFARGTTRARAEASKASRIATGGRTLGPATRSIRAGCRVWAFLKGWIGTPRQPLVVTMKNVP